MSPNIQQTPNILKEISQKPELQTIPQVTRFFSNMLEQVFIQTTDWEESPYDLALILLINFFSPEETDIQFKRLEAMQNEEDGSWGDNKIGSSCIVDTLQVLMTFCKAERPIPRSELLPQTLINLFIECFENKDERQDPVAFELIVQHLIKFLFQNSYFLNNYPEVRNVIIKFLITPEEIRDYEEKKDYIGEIRDYIGELVYKGMAKQELFRLLGLFEPGNTISFSLEEAYFIDDLQVEELRKLKDLPIEGGGIGLSPAATAGIILLIEDKLLPAERFDIMTSEEYDELLSKLYSYLQRVFIECKYFPDLYPADTSKPLWALIPFVISGDIYLLIEQNPDILDMLKKILARINIGPDGVGWSNIHLLKDLDDTSETYNLIRILANHGLETQEFPFDIFDSFENIDGTYSCYKFEGDPSFGSLLHLGEAMHQAKTYFEIQISTTEDDLILYEAQENLQKAQNIIDKVSNQLYGYYHFERFNIKRLRQDKWHFSKYYCTNRWLSSQIMLDSHPEMITEIAKQVILEQKESGGYGDTKHEETVEETAYMITGLNKLLENLISSKDSYIKYPEKYEELIYMIDEINDAIEKATIFFEKELSKGKFKMPSLWISKNGYLAKFWTTAAITQGALTIAKRKNPKYSPDRFRQFGFPRPGQQQAA